MWALAMLACKGNQPDLPKKIVGTWEVHQVEVAAGEVDAMVAVTNGHPGCTWGRMTLTFEEDAVLPEAPAVEGMAPGHFTATTDVMCPTKDKGEVFGCTVSARVPADWDVVGGKWVVAQGTTVRNRTRPIDTMAMASGTACEAKVSSGEYEVVTVRGQKWKWEMRTPDGTVYRLRAPQNERPDFVAALQREQRAASAPVPVEGEN
jgi:hypothetical protein